jgi:hypothetical protein
MEYQYNDGGREAAGYKGTAGDCVARSIAIASGLPYAEVYAALAKGTGSQTAGKRGKRSASARSGISVTRKWFKDYMASIGFVWTPTMGIGTGCKVHLHDGELPMGNLVVSVSKHYTAVIDGVVNDTWNPQRETYAVNADGTSHVSRRCVYGYWAKQ